MAHKVKNGNWAVRWREYCQDGQIKQRSKTFERRIDAEKFEAEKTLGAIHKNDERKVITFADFSDIWYRDHCLVKKAPTQHIEDRRVIDKFLKPAFGRSLAYLLTRNDLIDLQSSLSHKRKLSPKSINNITGLARKIMQDAHDWGYIPENPFLGVKPLPIPEAPIEFWTFAEKKIFLDYAREKDPLLWKVVSFVLNTGLRRGEVEGLFRDCLDFDRREVTVRRNYNHMVKTLFEHTKGKRIRRVPMNDTVFDMLKDLESAGPKQRVFPDLAYYRLRRVARGAGVTVIGFHALRHTFASHMAMSGCPIFLLKELLGHTDIKTTMRYAHLCQDSLKGMTGILDNSGVRHGVLFPGIEKLNQ